MIGSLVVEWCIKGIKQSWLDAVSTSSIVYIIFYFLIVKGIQTKDLNAV